MLITAKIFPEPQIVEKIFLQPGFGLFIQVYLFSRRLHQNFLNLNHFASDLDAWKFLKKLCQNRIKIPITSS